jgi:hypothetical protein
MVSGGGGKSDLDYRNLVHVLPPPSLAVAQVEAAEVDDQGLSNDINSDLAYRKQTGPANTRSRAQAAAKEQGFEH